MASGNDSVTGYVVPENAQQNSQTCVFPAGATVTLVESDGRRLASIETATHRIGAVDGRIAVTGLTPDATSESYNARASDPLGLSSGSLEKVRGALEEAGVQCNLLVGTADIIPSIINSAKNFVTTQAQGHGLGGK